MLNAVIIDDERHCIETVVWKLNEYCSSVKILGQFQKSIEALDFIKKTPNVDILFMDIEMPNINGFEMLKFIDTQNTKIVLTTAYEKYALDALKMHVYDYLLKPIDQLELIKLVSSIENENDLRKSPTSAKKVISISTQESIEFVLPQEILFCQAHSNYCMIHFVNKRKKMASKTLKDIEAQLADFSFFRTHQSYLINLNYVKEIRKSDNSSLILSDDTSIPITKLKRLELIELMNT